VGDALKRLDQLMATVPTLSGPISGASLNPGDRTTRTRPLPGAFGMDTARNLESLGQSLGQAADRGSDFLLKQQGLANESMTRDALTEYDRQAADLWTNYSNLEGKAAVDGYAAYQAALAKLRTSTIATAPNDAMKLALNDAVTRRSGQYYAAAGDYRAKQDKAWSLQSSASAAEQAINNATLFRDNPDIVAQHIAEGEGDVRNQAEIHGWDETTTAVQIAKYRGKAYAEVIQNRALTDPLGAQAMFDSVRGTLDADSQSAIGAYLKPKVLDAKSDALVAETAGSRGFVPPADRDSLPAGMRNNNPGNIKYISGSSFRGVVGPSENKDQGDSQMVFATAEDGMTAMVQLARRKYSGGKTTANQLIAGKGGWTPGNTQAAANVARSMGLSPDDDLRLDSPDQMKAFARGLLRQEHGAASDRYSDAMIASAVDGGTAAPAMPSGTDKQRAIRDVMAATEGDPDLRQASLSKLNQFYNQQDSMYAQDRAVLERDVKATNEALQFGQTVAVPEERIRSLLPADDAERVIGTLQRSQMQGQLYNAVKMADPGQISEMRQDLMEGSGTLSEMIKRTNPLASEAEQFTNRQDALQAFEAAVKRRDEAIRADPARFSLQDPAVRTAMDKATRDPAQFGEYVAQTQAFQSRLGIPRSQQRVLTDDQRASMLTQITQADPVAADKYLIGLQRETGDAWGDVFGDLTRGTDGLPSDLIALGIMTDPAGRRSLVSALTQDREKPGTVRGSLPDTAAKDIDTKIEDGMAEFASTFNVAAGGQALGSALVKSAKTLAYSFASQGMSESAATERAISAIAGQFDVMVSTGEYNARAPKGLGSTMADASNLTRARLTAEDLAPPSDRQGLYSPEALSKIALQNAQGGAWVTSPSSDGWTLIGLDGRTVFRRDGYPVSISYEDAARLATTDETREGVNVGTPIEQQRRQRVGPSLGDGTINPSSTFGDLQPGQEGYQ
jgi:hypothetical protein